jgi:hypothetical protein
LVKEFIRAVGPTAPRQHGDRINGESEVILASPQGILRQRLIPKQSDFHGGVHRLFQLGFHGAVLNWPCSHHLQELYPRNVQELGRIHHAAFNLQEQVVQTSG